MTAVRRRTNRSGAHARAAENRQTGAEPGVEATIEIGDLLEAQTLSQADGHAAAVGRVADEQDRQVGIEHFAEARPVAQFQMGVFADREFRERNNLARES